MLRGGWLAIARSRSGEVDSAISEGFGGGGDFITPSGNGVRFNFAADPEARAADTAPRATDPRGASFHRLMVVDR